MPSKESIKVDKSGTDVVASVAGPPLATINGVETLLLIRVVLVMPAPIDECSDNADITSLMPH